MIGGDRLGVYQSQSRAVHAARLGTFCCPFEYSGLTPCIVASQHLSRNFCLRDTSALGYVPDPPSLFSRTGGSGDETIPVIYSFMIILSRDNWRWTLKSFLRLFY